MLLFIHLALAGLGILLTLLLVVMPRILQIRLANITVAGTLLSGVALTIIHPAHLSLSCIAGLIYFSVCGAAVYSAHLRLQAQNS